MSARFVSDRILFIDIARYYAIALVFYGHFIEELMLLKNPVAASQYKFIYSFHMVLFILLAGYAAKERDDRRRRSVLQIPFNRTCCNGISPAATKAPP